MRYSIAALALAGAAAAMPSHFARDTVVNDVEVVQEVQWVTDVVTVTGAPPAASPAPAAASPAAVQPAVVQHNQAAAPPAPTTFVQVVTQAPAAPPAPASTPAAAASPAASPSASSSSSDPNSSDAILAVCNKWRSAYNLGAFTWDTELAGNAAKTGKDDQGTNENHELNGNSMAQVITPGINNCDNHNCAGLSSPFELAYVSGWLCEIPSASQLGGKCPTYTSAGGMDLSSGETGHADILKNPDYTKIGCSFAGNGQAETAQWTGLWICDLA